ncbi:hypothetical protein RM780_24115 [Streptomyces sp. DSM 44917]|uniref:Transmembrane protein n=1 Tax=Streptomyces boetiae TaxID=3075541 RepID=A0ABU2LET7_9ACTN|nr:hypothetical protein [Streptomyces sp. DSM 44917]MDT0310016.1 hypothetical protein [Streptomyces sp. DSM 44917]
MSADGLPPEDQADVHRLLDDALRTARLTTGADDAEIARLRELALTALPDLASAAEAEHERLSRLRQQLPGRADSRPAAPTAASAAGVATAFFALVPVLAAVAALVFLLLGYALGLAEPEPALAEPMRGVGWVFAGLAGAGLLAAVAGLVVTAARNKAPAAPPLAEEVARAREDWLRALHDRGIAPFLRLHATRLPHPRHPHPHHHNPRFTSPHFTSPRFGSPADHGRGSGSGPEATSPPASAR